jgi:hypothetical protein
MMGYKAKIQRCFPQFPRTGFKTNQGFDNNTLVITTLHYNNAQRHNYKKNIKTVADTQEPGVLDAEKAVNFQLVFEGFIYCLGNLVNGLITIIASGHT